VQKARASGRLVLHADGSINAAASDAGRAQATDPSMQRGRALHTTSDFPAILAAVTNKTLRDAYQAAPRTFPPIARRATAADFKDMHRLQLGEAPQLEKVNEAGEFKRGSLGEGKESYRVETWGKVIGITRQVIINDDLDAFTRIPALFGTAAATLESDVVWGIVTSNPNMADGGALFHASHKNLVGTGTALDVANLGKARAQMSFSACQVICSASGIEVEAGDDDLQAADGVALQIGADAIEIGDQHLDVLGRAADRHALRAAPEHLGIDRPHRRRGPRGRYRLPAAGAHDRRRPGQAAGHPRHHLRGRPRDDAEVAGARQPADLARQLRPRRADRR
jgi:hypothetical protein